MSSVSGTCPDNTGHLVKESVYKAEPYVPTLWYYDALSFLEGVVTSESFLAEPEAIETEYLWSASEEDSELDGQSSSSPPVKRKKISNTDFVQYENAPERKMDHENVAGRKMKDENVAGRKMKDEEWEIIGKSIGLQLRDLETRQLTIAQKIISDTIYYGKMGMLCGKSCVALQADVNATESTSRVPYHFVTISDSEQSPHSVSSSTPKSRKTHIFSSQIPPQPVDPLVKSESSPIII